MKLIKFKLPGEADWRVQPEENPAPEGALEVQSLLPNPLADPSPEWVDPLVIAAEAANKAASQ